jgi:hypothetical protein
MHRLRFSHIAGEGYSPTEIVQLEQEELDAAARAGLGDPLAGLRTFKKKDG